MARFKTFTAMLLAAGALLTAAAFAQGTGRAHFITQRRWA